MYLEKPCAKFQSGGWKNASREIHHHRNFPADVPPHPNQQKKPRKITIRQIKRENLSTKRNIKQFQEC